MYTNTRERNSMLGCCITTLPDYTSLRYVQFPPYSTPWTGNDTTWSAGGFMDTSNEFTILSLLHFSPSHKKFRHVEYKNNIARYKKHTFSAISENFEFVWIFDFLIFLLNKSCKMFLYEPLFIFLVMNITMKFIYVICKRKCYRNHNSKRKLLRYE